MHHKSSEDAQWYGLYANYYLMHMHVLKAQKQAHCREQRIDVKDIISIMHICRMHVLYLSATRCADDNKLNAMMTSLSDSASMCSAACIGTWP